MRSVRHPMRSVRDPMRSVRLSMRSVRLSMRSVRLSMRSVRLSMRANFLFFSFWRLRIFLEHYKVQSSAIIWGVAIESMGVAKTSFCHYAMKILKTL